VVNERTYHITPSADAAPAPVWLHDMTLEANDGKPIVINTEFNRAWKPRSMVVVGDRAESDGYNALILRTALSWREISAIGPSPAPAPESAAVQPGLYVGDFAQQHRDHRQHCRSVPGSLDPHLVPPTPTLGTRRRPFSPKIEEQLKSVASLDEDRILRLFTNLVQATVRTNLWQIGQDGASASGDLLQIRSAQDRGLPARGRFTRFSSIRRVSKAFICVRQSGARRPALVRPAAGFPTRSSAWSSAAGQECRHRAGRRQRRLRAQTAAATSTAMPDGGRHRKPIASSFAPCSNSPIISMGDTIVPPADTVRTMAMTLSRRRRRQGHCTFSDTANAISAEKNHWSAMLSLRRQPGL